MPVFSATMSRVRFEFILKHLCFDDHSTGEDRWKNDRYATMREFFEDCNTRFGKMLVPEDYLSLDETLYPMRTQIAFKRYNLAILTHINHTCIVVNQKVSQISSPSQVQITT